MNKILLEQSLKTEENSKLDKILNLHLKDKIDETNTSSNISGYKKLMTGVITKLTETSDMNSICSVIPALTPEGVIPVASATILTGANSDEVKVTDILRTLQVSASTGVVDGDTVTSSGGATGLILHSEEKLLVIKVTSGTFVKAETIKAGTITIEQIYPASHATGFMTPNYAGEYSTASGEALEDMKEIQYKLSLVNVVAKSKLLSTGWTVEALSDLLRQYGIKLEETLVNSISKIIDDFNRQKTISFMKANAKIRPILNLPSSYGINGGISNIYADIWNRINQCIGAIGTNTATAGASYSVIASSNVYGAMKTILKKDITMRNGICYMPGNIGLIEDSYSFTDYMIVALNDDSNNSAVIYAPYDYAVMKGTDPETFEELVKILVRSSVNNNLLVPLDEDGKNVMMEYTEIEGIGSLTNTF